LSTDSVDQLRTAISAFVKDGITTQNACMLLENQVRSRSPCRLFTGPCSRSLWSSQSLSSNTLKTTLTKSRCQKVRAIRNDCPTPTVVALAGFTKLSEKNLIRFLKSNKLFVREVGCRPLTILLDAPCTVLVADRAIRSMPRVGSCGVRASRGDGRREAHEVSRCCLASAPVASAND
jgi:hypothetical protein